MKYFITFLFLMLSYNLLSQNRVVNGDMEQWTNGANVPDGYVGVGKQTGNDTGFFLSADAHSGTKSLNVRYNGGGAYRFNTAEMSNLEPGIYAVKFWVKGKGLLRFISLTQKNVSPSRNVKDGNYVALTADGTDESYVEEYTDWTEKVFHIEIPKMKKGDYCLHFSISYTKELENKPFLFDDISLEYLHLSSIKMTGDINNAKFTGVVPGFDTDTYSYQIPISREYSGKMSLSADYPEGVYVSIKEPKDADFDIRKKLVTIDYDDLLIIRDNLNSGSTQASVAYNRLITLADAIMLIEPESVVTGVEPPSGDPRDFYSIGKYCWPDTMPGKTVDDPWIRIDGVRNPVAESDDYDLRKFNSMMTRVSILTLAWFYTDEELYAEKTTDILRTWFTDQRTGMKPNMNYAAALPGVYNGSSAGIIFGESLIDLLDYVNILYLSESWTEADNRSLKEWFTQYTEWLRTSTFGIQQSNQKNNLGAWYNAQLAAHALYIDDLSLLDEMIARGKEDLADQIALAHPEYPNGSLPKEMQRSQSYQYSIYGLKAFATLGCAAKLVDDDFWTYKTANNKTLKQAYNFLYPYLLQPHTWQWPSITNPENLCTDAIPLIRQALKTYKTNDMQATANYLQSVAAPDAWKIWLTGTNRK